MAKNRMFTGEIKGKRSKRFVISAVILTLIMTCALTACGGKDDTKTESKDTLVVGLDDTFAPMGFRDSKGELVGFDIDMAKAVGKKLNMKVDFKAIDWDSKEMELKSGSIDCVWNGMSVTPERKEKMSLSAKYLDNKIVVMALKSSDIDVKDSNELANLKIGTQVDSSALARIKADKNYKSFSENVSEYDTYDDAIMDLKAGRVDVIVVDQVLGEYANKNLGDIMKKCEFSFGNDYYVIGFEKKNTKLRDKVNKALKELIDDGTASKISKKWFGEDIVVYEEVK